jgi:hypothetical protein
VHDGLAGPSEGRDTTDLPYCSSVSAASSEALTGTASRYRLWLMLEQPGPWGHRALIESGLPIEVGSHLRVMGRQLGMRVLLIKQRERLQGPRQCYFAYTGVEERRLRSLELDDPADLLDADLPALAAQRFEGVGEEVAGPLYLVCTHGKHDPCCAREGGPLFRALKGSGDEAVWECTHIGGDRFAGNLVCFPHGMYFGRVTPAEGPRVAEAYARGHIALHRYRGRSAFPPAVQAAEEEVRRRHGLLGVDDLELVRHEAHGRVHRVELSGPTGRRYLVEVEIGHLDPRPLTCKADHPHAPRAFVVREIETVED